VIFSWVSSGNMAKQLELSLLDECCRRRLSSSRADFRITDMGYKLQYIAYGMQRMCHIGITGAASKRLCDATARLQTSLSYMITGMMYTLYNLILVGRDIQKFQIP